MSTDYKGVCHPWFCDVMGHMTTRHFIAMFDDASYHFLFRVFGWTGANATIDKVGWADVKHTIEYKQEVSTGQLLEISGKITKVGSKSITVLYTMNESNSENVVATLESVSVLFDTTRRVAICLTEEMKNKAKEELMD